jgi:glutathione S-transferase
MEEVVLYYDITSQPARAVMIYLDICRVPHKKVPIRITKGEHLSEDFKKVSPSQTIPTLLHKNLVLYESHAILSYISTVFNPNSSWYPEDPVLRAQVDCYLHWHHLHVRLGCAYFLHNKYMAPLIHGKSLPDIEALTTQAREDSFFMLEAILSDFPFVARTNQASIADLSCYSELVSLKWFGFNFSPFPKLQDWMKRLSKFPEIMKYDKELFKFTPRVKL